MAVVRDRCRDGGQYECNMAPLLLSSFNFFLFFIPTFHLPCPFVLYVLHFSSEMDNTVIMFTSINNPLKVGRTVTYQHTLFQPIAGALKKQVYCTTNYGATILKSSAVVVSFD